MRLPWVSRDAHDVVLAQLAEARESVNVLRGLANATRETGGDNLIRARMAEDRASRAERLFDDLLSRYHMLRLQGASEAPATPVMPDRPAPDPIMAALNEATAGKGVKARKAALAQLERDKEAGLSPEQIIARIHRGNRVADEFENPVSPPTPQNPGADRPPS